MAGHEGHAILRSIYALGQNALAGQVDIEHPQIHDAITAGMFTMDKIKQIELISRYNSRNQRDFRAALKDIQTLQADRKQAAAKEMAEAALVAKVCAMKDEPFHPIDFGFVSRRTEIDVYMLRQDYLEEAQIAGKFAFNFKNYGAAVANQA